MIDNKNRFYIATIFVLLISVIGVAYAYFTLEIKGNDLSSTNVIESGDVTITFNGTNKMEVEGLLPGETASKSFTVENNSDNNVASYEVKLVNVVNEFLNNDVQISLVCTSSQGSCNGMGETNVVTPKQDLVTNVIGKNTKHTYTIIVKYLDKNSNQNYNNGKSLSFTVNVVGS